jgi:hypothetical protein
MAKNKLGYGEKAARIMEMLNQGVSVRQIRREVGASPGYIYNLKKHMAHGVAATVDAKPKPGEFIEANSVQDVNNVNAILNERGKRYGDFLGHAIITQGLKGVAYEFADGRGQVLSVDQIEALDMIFHKIGRILNGDPDYADSWIDIAGYAKLVADRLEGKVR